MKENSQLVVTVLENKANDIVKIITKFFAPEAISVFIPAKDITINKDKTLFNAVTKDPRGFDITWSADIKNGKLTGIYFQSGDAGEFLLEEVIDPST